MRLSKSQQTLLIAVDKGPRSYVNKNVLRTARSLERAGLVNIAEGEKEEFTVTRVQGVNKKRLLRVAQALRESPDPKKFTMAFFGWRQQSNREHPCGTPACALGHYAARRDLQDTFFINRDRDVGVFPGKRGERVFWTVVTDHFGFSDHGQTLEFFGPVGCDDAKTPEQAIAYIERAIAEAENDSQ